MFVLEMEVICEKWMVEFETVKAPVKLAFIRADDSWPTSLSGFWGNLLCKYYLGVNQDCSSILTWDCLNIGLSQLETVPA